MTSVEIMKSRISVHDNGILNTVQQYGETNIFIHNFDILPNTKLREFKKSRNLSEQLFLMEGDLL